MAIIYGMKEGFDKSAPELRKDLVESFRDFYNAILDSVWYNVVLIQDANGDNVYKAGDELFRTRLEAERFARCNCELVSKPPVRSFRYDPEDYKGQMFIIKYRPGDIGVVGRYYGKAISDYNDGDYFIFFLPPDNQELILYIQSGETTGLVELAKIRLKQFLENNKDQVTNDDDQ